jgi:hypothetical protein
MPSKKRSRDGRPVINEVSELDEIRNELREIKELLLQPAPRPDDLVDAGYIAARTGLKLRTVKDGKAGTNVIPRVSLKAEGSSRSLVRYPRAAADKFVAELASRACTPQQRAASVTDQVLSSRAVRRARNGKKNAGASKSLDRTSSRRLTSFPNSER